MQDSLAERAKARSASAVLRADLEREQQSLQHLAALAARKSMLDAAYKSLAQADRDPTALA